MTARAKASEAAKAAPADKAATKAATKATDKVVVVTGRRKGRWRIEKQFFDTPVEIPRGDLTDEQLKALQKDPVLTVEIRDAD